MQKNDTMSDERGWCWGGGEEEYPLDDAKDPSVKGEVRIQQCECSKVHPAAFWEKKVVNRGHDHTGGPRIDRRCSIGRYRHARLMQLLGLGARKDLEERHASVVSNDDGVWA